MARYVEALRRVDDTVLAALSRVVTPRATYVPAVIHLTAEAASTSDSVDLKTGDAPAADSYNPLLTSVLADLIRTRIKDKDPRAPATWLPLLSRESLDTILAAEVSPELFRRAAAVEPTDQAKRRALVEAMAAKESMVAGLLSYLAEQHLVPTLADLFTPPGQSEVDTSQFRGLQRMLDPLETASRAEALNRVSLSPVGIVHLFRQYFFEFDTFLGPPVQHVWLSPGSSLELIESQTRRTLVERVVEEGQEITQSRTSESKLEDEVSTAVKDENERNTKLGFSVSANQRWVWGDANETATMDMSDTQKQAREQTHKQMRQQSERLSTEIKRSFKTTFRTVTETTDTSSRRYVLANGTDKLINYELRRKMRRVGVQVQDLGTQLCWQSFVDDPGAVLGLAKLVHIAAPPAAAAVAPANELPMPEDYTEDVVVQFGYPFNGYIRPVGGSGTGWWIADVELTPRDGYEPVKVGEVRWTAGTAAVKLKLGRKTEDAPKGTPDPNQPALSVFLYNAHGERNELFAFTVPVAYRATDDKRKQVSDQNKLLAAKRDLELDQKQREAYLTAAQQRVAAASKIQIRDYDVLREEERVVVYRRLLEQLMRIDGKRPTQPALLHKLAELINSMFDVEAMLYFVAPEWWRPRLHEAHPTFAPELDRLGDPRLETPGGGPVRDPSIETAVEHIVRDSPTGLDDHTVGWANEGDMNRRDNYFITADSAPARLGSSLGWLLQLDGDHQRNAFLNAPWVKAVVPIRPGKELAALNWLSDPSIEGADGLDDLYQPAADGESTRILAGLRAYAWSDPALVTRYHDLDPAGLTIRDVLRYVAVTVLAKHEAGAEVVTEQLEPGVTLSNPPNGSAVPLEPSTYCLGDAARCKKETADRANSRPYFARNRDWNPRPLPKITTPISWPFLKSPIFKKSAFAKWDILNLAFVDEPAAGYTVKVYSVTYDGNERPPQFIAVAYPMDLDVSKPPPFLVHYKHIPGQSKNETRFVHFRPFGFDWLYFDIWNWWVYNAGRRADAGYDVDMPFLSAQQVSFGFPYQLRQANKQYVIVLPQISRVFDPVTQQLRDYQLYSAAMLRKILLAIQGDILSVRDDTLSHVAISANSSGCNVFAKFLTDNVAAMKQDPKVEAFMNDELNEIFVFDPPEDFADAMIAAMGGWLKLSSRRSTFKGKSVRFYTHSFPQRATSLTGGKSSPFKRGTNGLWESPDKRISVAYLPFDQRNGDDVWQQTYDEIRPDGRLRVNNFDFVHHAIPALCLTDAAARSLYV